MSKGENFIHLKFEHTEAVNSRRDLLTSEIDLINIIKSFESFMALRALELKLKEKFFRESKKIEAGIKRLEKSLPDVEVPRMLKQSVHKKKEHLEEDFGFKETKNNDLESQLMDIQRKLRQLSG